MKPNEQQEADFACMPVSKEQQAKYGLLSYTPQSGAVQENCDKCKTLIWVGVNQQKKRSEFMAAKAKIRTVCLECAARAHVENTKAGHDVLVQDLGGQSTFEPLSNN